ncbi:hypothetical protein Tco_1548138 [Tanacetum coccineum]
MTTLADKSLFSGGNNKPSMLEKHVYDSWKSRMELYMMNRPHGRMILASVEKGKRIENGAKTGIIGLNLVKFNYYSKPRRSREKSRNMPLERARKNKSSNALGFYWASP